MDLDILFQEANFESEEGQAGLHIYGQDLFLSKTPTEIRDEINQLDNTLYMSDEGVVGITSVDTSEAYLGNVVLEYMAVDQRKQGQGFGSAILGILKQEAREAVGYGEGFLYVTVQSDTVEFYTQNGAVEDDDGTVYFKLDD